MNEMNELKEFCQKNFIPFWYHEKDGEHYLNFGVDKNLRLFCGFWHFFENEFVNDIFLQYFHFPEGNMIRVVCQKDKISSVLEFFRSPIFALDVSLFGEI